MAKTDHNCAKDQRFQKIAPSPFSTKQFSKMTSNPAPESTLIPKSPVPIAPAVRKKAETKRGKAEPPGLKMHKCVVLIHFNSNSSGTRGDHHSLCKWRSFFVFSLQAHNGFNRISLLMFGIYLLLLSNEVRVLKCTG